MADGKLDEQSILIQLAMQSFFTAMDNIRMYIKSKTEGWQSLLNEIDATNERLSGAANVRSDTGFQNVDKKVIDKYIDEMKAEQKKMNNKFGLLSSPLLKSASYKAAYNGLKSVSKTVNDLISMLTSGPYSSLNEVYNLIKASKLKGH